MKALSIKQPWAALIAHGVKDVENRTWRTNFRGRVYIHASQAHNRQPLTEKFTQAQAIEWANLMERLDYRRPPETLGAIIGEVDIVDCIKDPGPAARSIWGEAGHFHWILANAVIYPVPVFCKGRLNFWDPPGDLAGLPPVL